MYDAPVRPERMPEPQFPQRQESTADDDVDDDDDVFDVNGDVGFQPTRRRGSHIHDMRIGSTTSYNPPDLASSVQASTARRASDHPYDVARTAEAGQESGSSPTYDVARGGSAQYERARDSGAPHEYARPVPSGGSGGGSGGSGQDGDAHIYATADDPDGTNDTTAAQQQQQQQGRSGARREF